MRLVVAVSWDRLVPRDARACVCVDAACANYSIERMRRVARRRSKTWTRCGRYRSPAQIPRRWAGGHSPGDTWRHLRSPCRASTDKGTPVAGTPAGGLPGADGGEERKDVGTPPPRERLLLTCNGTLPPPFYWNGQATLLRRMTAFAFVARNETCSSQRKRRQQCSA